MFCQRNDIAARMPVCVAPEGSWVAFERMTGFGQLFPDTPKAKKSPANAGLFAPVDLMFSVRNRKVWVHRQCYLLIFRYLRIARRLFGKFEGEQSRSTTKISARAGMIF